MLYETKESKERKHIKDAMSQKAFEEETRKREELRQQEEARKQEAAYRREQSYNSGGCCDDCCIVQ
jgi:hypothetical protein